MRTLLASIPSPDSGTIDVGPLPLHMYGLMLAVGVLVAVAVARRRYAKRGHPAKDIDDIAIWVVIAGVVGARLYHVISDFQLFEDDIWRAFRIWEGGLSIWGAVAGGAIAVLVLAKRKHLDFGDVVDSMAPGVVLAQAIGRWGNWFNQELFGEPTTLPWGLEIDPAKRPLGYEQYQTFHPIFLYESLYCLALFFVLVWAERRFKFVKGQTFALYAALYCFPGRFVFENMRIDPANEIGPLRLNAWVSLAIAAIAWTWFFALRRRAQGGNTEEPGDVGPADTPSGADEPSVS